MQEILRKERVEIMIKIEHTSVIGFDFAIRGMRNPYNSWKESDSRYENGEYIIGAKDKALMAKLVSAGTDHSKFMRFINVTFDITAPLYFYKQMDAYKVGTVRNSCSTMHKIAAKEFEFDDFSNEHLMDGTKKVLGYIIKILNTERDLYLQTTSKEYWWQMIQILPSGYNQKSTMLLNYAVLRNMYHARKNHKLDEWKQFCNWCETLPQSWLITMDQKEVDKTQ